MGHHDYFGGHFTVRVCVMVFRRDALCLRVVYRVSLIFLGCSWCIMSPGVFLSCTCDTLFFRIVTSVVSRFFVVALGLLVWYHDLLQLFCCYLVFILEFL